MALSTELKNLADQLAADLAKGSGSRQTLGDKTPAWGWTGGLPLTVASYIEAASSETLSFAVTRVGASGTPVTAVTEGGSKPSAVAITADSVQLAKFAGYGSMTTEQTLNGEGLLPAVVSVLGAGALLAYETAAMTSLTADAGATASGADWAAALAAGQAAVLGNGGSPGLMVVSAGDYGTLIGAITAAAGFSVDPRSAVGAYLGAGIHVSPRLPAGTAFVMDPAAALAVQHKTSPVVLIDPYSGAQTNEVRVYAELFAGLAVVNAGHIAKVSVA